MLVLFFKKKIIVDIHGAMPEECRYNKNRFLYKTFQFIEPQFFKIASIIVHVSEQMKNYYFEKYPYITKKVNIVKPIYPNNVLCHSSIKKQEKLRSELGVKSDTIIFIYSGGLQQWQNFDTILSLIEFNISNPRHHYIILSGNVDQIKSKTAHLTSSNLTIRRVAPEELNTYYDIAHYGFILRDDHILNKVASPTKMIEYLYFGLVPIVKYVDIGDVSLYNYEYIPVSDSLSNLPMKKSVFNQDIAVKILQKNASNNLFKIINHSL